MSTPNELVEPNEPELVNPVEYELAGEEDHLPKPTTYRIPPRKVTISIAVIDQYSLTRECIIRSLRDLANNLEISAFEGFEDCLRSTRDHELILYHAHDVLGNGNAEQRLAALKQILEIAPVIILSAVDCPASIFEELEIGARGYIPIASTTPELAIEIIHLVRAGGTFVPVSNLSARKIDPQGAPSKTMTTDQLTSRQSAVLNHLKLGQSNKIIAHELEMSESTVKVHIRNIMKKMKATNRTEVACRAHVTATMGPGVASQMFQRGAKNNT
jgi:DNA-binding NarL/FixJ family response regulator